jgi:hypothetical protein
MARCTKTHMFMEEIHLSQLQILPKATETELRGPDSHWGRFEFVTCYAGRLFCLRFSAMFISPREQSPGYYLKLGHNCFPSYPFELITR